MKKDKKLEIQPDVLIHMYEDLNVFKTSDNKYYITNTKRTFRSELYDDMEKAIRAAIDMKRKIY